MQTNVRAFQDYLTKEKNYSPLTVGAYSKDLEALSLFLKAEFDIDSLEEVNYGQIRSWIVSLSDSGISNRSINRKISSLKTFYRFLLKIKAIKVSPLAKHQPLKTLRQVQVPFSEKEMNKIKTEPFPDDFSGVRDRLMVELLYTTGIRRAELIGLKTENIDLSAQTIKVLGKRNKERILPLLDSVIELIKDYTNKRKELEVITDVNYLFLTKKGTKIYESLVYGVINRYLSSVSDKVKTSPHVLRHSFATHLLNNGADLNSVKELLGHSSLASTQIYLNSSLSELKQVHIKAHPRNKG
ncbi:MAG: tyrosine-type recombinase/integrase [Flavobacteriaceae bacterium]